MPTTAELIAWARTQAEVLERDMRWISGQYGAYWSADPPSAKSSIRARAITALDFLDRYAGRHSAWSSRAVALFDSSGGGESMESGARAVGDLLREWADQVDAGLVTPVGAATAHARQIAETDLLGQVRALLDGTGVHPAAPIVLAAAALELALRTMVEDLELEMTERPSIASFARRLRSEGLLTAQDVKEVEQMAGLRNAAAHGRFEELSVERAGLLEQQVNLFLRRLEGLGQ